MMTQRGPITKSVTHEPTAEERARAARVVASCARDTAELTELLDMLGLAASEARAPGSAADRIEQNERTAAHTPRGRELLASELAEMLDGSEVTSGSGTR